MGLPYKHPGAGVKTKSYSAASRYCGTRQPRMSPNPTGKGKPTVRKAELLCGHRMTKKRKLAAERHGAIR